MPERPGSWKGIDPVVLDADAMARLEHALLNAPHLDACERWLCEGFPT